jgi:hypothetical protein
MKEIEAVLKNRLFWFLFHELLTNLCLRCQESATPSLLFIVLPDRLIITVSKKPAIHLGQLND